MRRTKEMRNVDTVERKDEEEKGKETGNMEEEFYLDSDEEFDEQFQVERIIIRDCYDAPQKL